jgi:ribosomal protein L37AE/L43A
MFNTTLLISLGAIFVVALGVCLYVRWRKPKEEGYAHFKCPGCRRRLRYKRKQVGHKGECSNCGRALVFPPISETSK